MYSYLASQSSSYFFRNWEGVIAVYFLKIMLKDDLELNPESKAISNMEFWEVSMFTNSFFASSTRYLFTKSKKFRFNFSLITCERCRGPM